MEILFILIDKTSILKILNDAYKENKTEFIPHSDKDGNAIMWTILYGDKLVGFGVTTDLAQFEKYDNFVKGGQTTELKSSEWEDIFDLQKIIDDSPNQVLVEYNFDGSGFYLDVLCSLVFSKDKEIIERLKNLNNYSSELSEIKNNKYYYVIPKHYLEHLNGIKYKKLPPESDRPEFEL